MSASACPLIDDPNHCANMTTSPCLADQVCDACVPSSQNNGCVAADQAMDHQLGVDGCQLQGGVTGPDTTTEDEGTTTTTVDATETTTIDLDTTVTEGGTETTTTGPPPMCDEPDGTYMESCPVDAPFCVNEECTRCNNDGEFTSCEDAPGAPGTVCSRNGGCVECSAEDATACGGTEPICDTTANACTACTAHDQCPGGAGCHLFEGSCLPSDAVYMVDGAAPMCGMAGQPHCNITNALMEAGTGNDATIRVAAGIYVNNVVITSDAAVAIIGEGDVSIIGSGGSPGVTVNTNGVGYLAALSVENNGMAPGVESAGDLRMDDSTIRDADLGLLSTDGRVHLEDVRVINNALTGVSVGGTEDVVLRNVIIAGNGSGTSPRGFVTTGATPFTMVYTTIAANGGTNAGAINCSGEAARSVRNSILVSVNFMNAINCGENLTVTHSVISDTDYEVEPTNFPVVDDSGLIFDSVYEIGVGSVADGVAVWMVNDPLFDINGVMRPGTDGTPDAAGANVPN